MDVKNFAWLLTRLDEKRKLSSKKLDVPIYERKLSILAGALVVHFG